MLRDQPASAHHTEQSIPSWGNANADSALGRPSPRCISCVLRKNVRLFPCSGSQSEKTLSCSTATSTVSAQEPGDPTLPTSKTWGWKLASWQCGLCSQSEILQLRGAKLFQKSTPKRRLPLKALGQMQTDHESLTTHPHTLGNIQDVLVWHAPLFFSALRHLRIAFLCQTLS